MVGYWSVAALCLIVGTSLSIKQVSSFSFAFLSLCTLLLLPVSCGVRLCIPVRSVLLKRGSGVCGDWLVWAVPIIACAYLAVAESRVGVAGFWSDLAQEQLSGGIAGHLNILMSAVTIAFGVFGTAWTVFRILLLVLGFVSVSIYPIKGPLLFILFSIVFGRMLLNRDPVVNRESGGGNFRTVIFLISAGVAVFFGKYLIRLDDFDLESLIGGVSEISIHFLGYLVAGYVGMDYVLSGQQFSGGADIIFSPFTNFFSSVFGGDLINNVNDTFIEVIVGQRDGNVFSYFGTLVGYLGMGFGVFFGLLILFGAYVLLGSIFAGLGEVAVPVYAYFLANLFFGWFDYNFYLFRFYEMILFLFVISLVSCLRFLRSHPSNLL